MPDPEAVGIPEVHGSGLDAAANGACLFCGDWVELAQVPGYVVTVESASGFAEFVCHEACLADRTHPGATLPPTGVRPA